jgi:hypothetical protein
MFKLFMRYAGQSVVHGLYLLLFLLSPVISAQSEQPPELIGESTDTGLPPATSDDIALIQTAPQDSPDESFIVAAECRRIDKKLGSVNYNDCITLDLKHTGASSVSNAPILYKEYAPLPGKLPLGRVLLLGGVHGDEYSSVSIVFKWLQTLKQFHSGLFHWHIIPLVNPDGLLSAKSTRTNANGVDINRNFPTPDWDETAMKYWTGKTGSNPRQYPGPDRSKTAVCPVLLCNLSARRCFWQQTSPARIWPVAHPAPGRTGNNYSLQVS